ncbi:hypothetical protein [Campylobacter concisus]|uniref:hypothetical protein n=1 Tax=Campylobacter concisus TaxID=199 RepID=UPI00131BB2E7|nr:hypothetical protein [Campylobacter concisus]
MADTWQISKNCYSKNDMALCKKFDEIYEYGKLLREKRRCFGKANLSKLPEKSLKSK